MIVLFFVFTAIAGSIAIHSIRWRNNVRKNFKASVTQRHCEYTTSFIDKLDFNWNARKMIIHLNKGWDKLTLEEQIETLDSYSNIWHEYRFLSFESDKTRIQFIDFEGNTVGGSIRDYPHTIWVKVK